MPNLILRIKPRRCVYLLSEYGCAKITNLDDQTSKLAFQADTDVRILREECVDRQTLDTFPYLGVDST